MFVVEDFGVDAEPEGFGEGEGEGEGPALRTPAEWIRCDLTHTFLLTHVSLAHRSRSADLLLTCRSRFCSSFARRFRSPRGRIIAHLGLLRPSVRMSSGRCRRRPTVFVLDLNGHFCVAVPHSVPMNVPGGEACVSR